MQARFAGTAWTRCDSWYRDAHGRIVTNWPGYMHEYAERTRALDPADFALNERPPSVPVAPAGVTSPCPTRRWPADRTRPAPARVEPPGDAHAADPLDAVQLERRARGAE